MQKIMGRSFQNLQNEKPALDNEILSQRIEIFDRQLYKTGLQSFVYDIITINSIIDFFARISIRAAKTPFLRCHH